MAHRPPPQQDDTPTRITITTVAAGGGQWTVPAWIAHQVDTQIEEGKDFVLEDAHDRTITRVRNAHIVELAITWNIET